MGEVAEKPRSASVGAHSVNAQPTKLAQKIAPTIQINKENSAPNSVSNTGTRPATRGLAARSESQPAGAHAGTTSTSQHAQVRRIDASHSTQAATGKEDTHARQATALGPPVRQGDAPATSNKNVQVEQVAKKETTVSTQEVQLTSRELQEKTEAVFNYLTTKENFKDLSKWVEYLKPYCRKRSYGVDVLHGVLDLSIAKGQPEWLNNEHYFELWRFWASGLPADDQLEAFKMIENYGIGIRRAALYIHMATLKINKRDLHGALKVAENGLLRGAEPKADLGTLVDNLRQRIGQVSAASGHYNASSMSGTYQEYHSASHSASIVIASQGPPSGGSFAPIPSALPPGTPQQQHQDGQLAGTSEGTPSASLQSAIQARNAKNRQTSTPSSSMATAGSGSKMEASTPSPNSDTDSIQRTSANIANSTTSSAANAATKKTRTFTGLGGSRLGLRGGAQRLPKATSAAPAQPSSNAMEGVLPHESAEPVEKAHALPPITEDDSAMMQVDELISALPSAPHVSFKDPLTSPSSHALPESDPEAVKTQPHAEGALTGKSASTHGFSSPAITLSTSTSASASTASSSSTLVSSNPISGPQSSSGHSSQALAMKQLAEGIPSQFSSHSVIEPSASALPPPAKVSNHAPKTNVPRQQALASTFVAESASQNAAPNGSNAQPNVAPTSSSDALPRASSRQNIKEVVIPSAEKLAELQAATEAANAAAAALGRDVFIVRGKPFINIAAIGKGGTCSVYKVMDVKGNNFALKVITWSSDTMEVITGYTQEVKLLESVQGNPYVVKLYEYELVATSNTMYILFEFAETDLRKLFLPLKHKDASMADIVPGGRFGTDLDALRFYWRSMLSAVLVLHKHRIVHLDLKPANFVLVEGRVKIIDFGIAKKVMNDTMHAKVDDIAGTILYMAPESLRNTSGRGAPHKVGFPADVWSMGCILYQMVYGYTPFDHVSGLVPKMAAITADEPIQLQPIDNEELMDCMRRCLDKTHQNRPTIAQLLDHPFLGGSLRWAK